ncbi:kelch protein, putative [Plasmodium chabaudi adami]|uniref:Kelch protein, putative n=1 Tax=Plasmodium chabaudi adami TaxID=5826 RepID=A0A1D3RSN8_PLACE|nr:kelch protein, putative [Plasmodium chabaudi adami]
MNAISKNHINTSLMKGNYINDDRMDTVINNTDKGEINNNDIYPSLCFTNDIINGEIVYNGKQDNMNIIDPEYNINNVNSDINNMPECTGSNETNNSYTDNNIIYSELNIEKTEEPTDDIKIVYSYVVNDSKRQMNSNNELISINITIDENKKYVLRKKINKLPFFRYGHFLCLTKNGCILAIGGTDGRKKYALIEKYCHEKKKWKQINLMHFSRSNFCGICTGDNNLFVLGGEGNQHILKSVEYYDSKINSWRSLPPLNCVRHSASAIIFDNTIFIIGGKDGVGNYGKVHKSVEMLNLNEKNMKWEMCEPLKQARLALVAIVFDNKIYAIGGSTGVKDLKSVEIYDFKKNEWAEGPNLNFARSNFVAFIWKNHLVVYGGINNTNGDFLNCAEILKEKTNRWMLLNETLES